MVDRNKLTWEEAVEWLRRQPDKKDLVYQCYYDDPVEIAAERFSQSQEWLAVVKLLGKNIPGRVLDLGAGRGISSYAFAKEGCSVVAIEPDPGNIVGRGVIAKLKDNTGLSFEVIDDYGETLPFPDESFDIVYGRAILHHAENLSELCNEASRVLRPGGVFLATREHVISRAEDLDKFHNSHALHFLYGGEHAYLLEEYVKSISSSGLELKLILGPYDSVINFFPMSQEQFRKKLASVISIYFGKKLASWISKFNFSQKIYGRILSSRSDVPGRHYSFLAYKT